ncbi:MAG TPA: YdcF family protein [Mycobacteriales bacterium]|nr:YdcF family protein [Mycobacteriales bacterium]
MNDSIRKLTRVLWDYHNLPQELPSTVDFILAAGSHDDRVARHAAQLVLRGQSALLVTSGGYGKVTSGIRTEPEGERFRQIALADGVADAAIIVEAAAANTGDNVTLSRKLLADRGIQPGSGIIVTKPYMKRRALATAVKQWPEVTWWTSAPEIDLADYPSDEVPERRMIELMVGDLQRLDVYAEQGFQIPQEIPPAVWAAYTELIALGFDRYVIRA